MRKAIGSVVLVGLATAGCATKNYGRIQPLTGAERTAYTCREVDIEIAKVQSFQTQVAQGAKFNFASILGILGDYGIGNAMERSHADASAARRLQQLYDLKAERGCSGYSLNSADRRMAVAGVRNDPNAVVSSNPSDAPGTINLGGGVKMAPAQTLSGYCLKVPPGYIGTGAVNRPAITSARPICN